MKFQAVSQVCMFKKKLLLEEKGIYVRVKKYKICIINFVDKKNFNRIGMLLVNELAGTSNKFQSNNLTNTSHSFDSKDF